MCLSWSFLPFLFSVKHAVSPCRALYKKGSVKLLQLLVLSTTTDDNNGEHNCTATTTNNNKPLFS